MIPVKMFPGWYGPAVLLSASLLLAGCSEPSERKSISKPYLLPSEVTLDAHAERGREGEIYIAGSTNFPDGMKLWVDVEIGRLPLGAPKVAAQDDGVIIRNGRFRTVGLWSRAQNPYLTREMRGWPDAEKLKFRNRPFTAGNQRVRLTAYFNGAWQTRDVLALLGGDGAKALHGRILKLTDPDVTDSSKMVDDLETLMFPPLSPEAQAISKVKAAVLTVPGSGRSATDVEANIDLFFGDKDLKPAKGWTAKPSGLDVYTVEFDFINGEAGEQQAIWSADIKTGEVRYVNSNAKVFSWTPNY